MIQLTLTLKMTTAQVVETSVTVNNSPIQDYVHPDDQTQPTFEVYSRLGNEGLITILAQPPSSSSKIAILTSDHHGSNFSYNSQVLRIKHPVLGIKLNPLSLLFQMARNHRNNTNKRLQNNGFHTFQRNHMFSVALCSMRIRAWWLACVFCIYDPEPRVFFGFLWRQRS